tara:strand:- start:25400 stop:25864 length:465 start_codon:yes stop_codon:yes gene_type:complete
MAPIKNTKKVFLVGYRWHDTKNIEPLFAFGYGLSYTSFDISDVKVNANSYTENDKIVVSCKLANTGKSDGAEVVQVYIGKPNSKVERAVKELKGFSKLNLKSNTYENVEISIDVASLKYYDESISDWNLEKGEYIIYVGNASDNIAQELKITIG